MEKTTSDKKTIGEKYGDKKLMSKKPVLNPKFKDVKPLINTGKTINDVEIMSDHYLSKRRGELFKRLKGTTIMKLLSENNNKESIYNLANEYEEGDYPNENVSVTARPEDQSVYSYKTDVTAKTSVTAVTYATEMLGNLADLDYLLLDLREKEDYEKYHIKEAMSFPGPNISRDKFPVEMIRMKNKEGKLIIIYAKDERSGIPYATLLSQKGFDNIYFLSSGIEDFAANYPEFCDGTGVQQLINEKLQQEILKREANMKLSRSKLTTKANSIKTDTQSVISSSNRSISVDIRKNTQTSKMNSKTTSNQSIKNLTNNLKK